MLHDVKSHYHRSTNKKKKVRCENEKEREVFERLLILKKKFLLIFEDDKTTLSRKSNFDNKFGSCLMNRNS